jgi:hypothetical protein
MGRGLLRAGAAMDQKKAGAWAMFSHIARDAAFLAALARQIEQDYGLEIGEMAAAERGYYGETWKITARGGVYFAKLVADRYHAARYVRSFPIVEEMNHLGIDFVSRVAKAADGRLFTYFRGHALGLFAFIAGVHTEDYPLDQLFRLLARIYGLRLDLPMERETFGLETLDHYQALLRPVERRFDDLRRLLAAHQGKLAFLAARLRLFSAQCRDASAQCRGYEDGFRLTSGDVGGNVIMQGERMFIIDWDHLLLAPIERDLWWYICERPQIELANQILHQEGVPYTLRDERLAYYCYSRYFFHLGEYLHCYFGRPDLRAAMYEELAAYLSDDYWLNRQVEAANGYPAG